MFVALITVAALAAALWFVNAWFAGRLPWQQSLWGFQVGEVRGRELAIGFTYRPCDHYGGFQVTESAARVTIKVRGHDGRDVCNSSAVEGCHRIVLRAPLGDRELFDGHQVVPGRGPSPAAPASNLSPCSLALAR